MSVITKVYKKFSIMSAPELTNLPVVPPEGEAEPEITLEYFKACLKEYLKLDEEIKLISKALRQRRDKQTNLSQSLLIFLNKNEINQVQLEGTYAGQELIPDKVNRVKGPSATSILEIVNAKLAENPDLLKSITDEIDAHKEAVEVEKVKISKAKTGKKKAVPVVDESALSNALLLGHQ